MAADTVQADEGQLSQRDGSTIGALSSNAGEAAVNDLPAEMNDETRKALG